MNKSPDARHIRWAACIILSRVAGDSAIADLAAAEKAVSDERNQPE